MNEQMVRCEPGNLAIVIRDDDCPSNVGRIVEVDGPLEFNPDLQLACWMIQPLSAMPYSFIRRDGSVTDEVVSWATRVEHPDAWLLPIGNSVDETSEVPCEAYWRIQEVIDQRLIELGAIREPGTPARKKNVAEATRKTRSNKTRMASKSRTTGRRARMAKIIDCGSAPPNHQIYSGGPEMFSPRAFRPSSTPSVPATDGATLDKSTPSSGIPKEALEARFTEMEESVAAPFRTAPDSPETDQPSEKTEP